MASKPRSADRIIAEAIEAYRDAVAATGRINDGHKPVREIWDGLAPAQKSAVTRRLDAVGKDQIHKRGDRLASFVYDCVNGSPVSFPDPVPTDPAPAVADATSDVPGPSIDVPTATTVPGFSPVATRSAEYVILEAIVAYRGNATDGCGWHGNYAARDVYNETDGSLKDDIDLLVLRIGHSSLNAEPVDRFIDLVAYCVYGMDVSFPEPEAVTPVSGFSGPMPVSGGSPEAPTFSIGERVILARVATEGIRGQAGTVVRLVWGTHPEVRLDGFDGSDYPAGHHIANPENVDRPDPVPGFSDPVQGITADEVVGRIDAADSALAGRARLARVRVEPYTPEQRRDRRELEARWATIERERVERAALEAARPIVERQLNPAYGPDPLAHLGHRTSRAWEEMGEYRRADFAAWLAHLGYRPGEADHGPLRLDEQFDAFILECLEGTPVFPTPSDPKPPTGDDDGSDLRPGFPEARRPTLQLDPRPLHGPMGAGPDVAGLVGVVVAELLPGGGVAALPGSGRVGREPLGVIASLVILAHGPDQPVIRFDTAYPLPGDALDERFRNPDLHGRTGVDRLIPDDHRVPARHHRGPARPDPRPDATVPARSFLILAIGHKQYGLTIGGDVMTLEAPDGRQYEVTRGDDSTCSCPDWRMRHEGLPTQGCKHVRALRGVNLLPPVPGFSDRRPRECPGGDLARARLAFGMP